MLEAEIEVGGPGRRLGDLSVPDDPSGTVIFAHGSGSSRHSPRNRQVAEALNEGGIGTVLFDLLTTDEEVNRRNVFDIDLLAERLSEATDVIVQAEQVPDRPIGYFGASTGAAAALQAAVGGRSEVVALVSRGGRPDLAGSYLPRVTTPTLLIVGGQDPEVLELNRSAEAEMKAAETKLEVVPGAGHLFEEPGALDQVADLAREWFSAHFAAA